uniref:Protein FAM136A n=1 Tax=Acrobeloides nanus TaxID=290746 RepID=A0A914E0H3_9BILA
MFLCLADCYKDTRGSRQSVERCAESCGTTFKQVQRVMETELNGFQEQLQRCAMTCFDKQTQAFGPDPSKYSESQRGAFEEKLNKCVSQCADDHLKLLPKIKDRIISAFKS